MDINKELNKVDNEIRKTETIVNALVNDEKDVRVDINDLTVRIQKLAENMGVENHSQNILDEIYIDELN